MLALLRLLVTATALANLDCWSLHNNINFNASESKVLSVTWKKNPVC